MERERKMEFHVESKSVENIFSNLVYFFFVQLFFPLRKIRENSSFFGLIFASFFLRFSFFLFYSLFFAATEMVNEAIS